MDLDNSEQIEIEDRNENDCENEMRYLSSPKQLLPFISGFVNLGGDEEEEHIQNIHIEQDFHYNLHKIYTNEQKPVQHRHSQQKQAVHHEPRIKQVQRKESASLPSFFEELEKNADLQIENFRAYFEGHKFHDALTNLDNFLFMEDQKPKFLSSFNSSYLRTLQKIKNYRLQSRLDLQQLLKFICSIGIDFIQEMLNFMSKCEPAFCFQQIKQIWTETSGQSQPPQIQKCSFDFSEAQQKQPVKQERPIVSPKLDALQAAKKSRKAWSVQEIAFLQDCLNQHQNTSITNEQIEDIAQMLGRTWYSVQSKISKMKRVDNSDSRSQANSSMRSNQKAKPTVEEMIKMALSQLGGEGTKQQIIEKINQTHFNGALSQADACWRSIAQTLSSAKSPYIRKIMGTYKLANTILGQGDEENKMRNRLVWILQSMPGCKATLKELVQKYGGFTDEESQKRLQKQIKKVLMASAWFDKSEAFTIYMLMNKG